MISNFYLSCCYNSGFHPHEGINLLLAFFKSGITTHILKSFQALKEAGRIIVAGQFVYFIACIFDSFNGLRRNMGLSMQSCLVGWFPC